MAMNFVDVQPQSFLDYAWTSPTPAPPPAPKPSKTSRKQNRCCDQCRKGKRACDAAILEDTLLDPGSALGGPALFHYSDSFGCLAPCGNCEKTRKACTFQWLREQRIAQAAPSNGQSSAPPAKKRRTQSGSSQKPCGTARPPRPKQATQTNGRDTASGPIPHEFTDPGLLLTEFPGVTPMFNVDMSLSPSPYFDAPTSSIDMDQVGRAAWSANAIGDTQHEYLDPYSGNGSEMLDTSDDRSLTAVSSQTASSKGSDAVVRVPRKRRRRSSSRIRNGEAPCPILCLAASDLASSANNALLTEGLLRIYHDSFENHLSCWLTERTCPYVQGSALSLPGDVGPDWNRMYYRVFKLDHSSSIRGRVLSAREDKVASKAINLAILSYATQWAHSNRDCNAKYPFHSDEIDGRNGTSQSESPCGSFDRALRVSTWHQARNALKDAAEIESFRVVLALLVFSLTQRPLDGDQESGQAKTQNKMIDELSPVAKEDVKSVPSVASFGSSDEEMDECADLLSKLDLAIDNGQPPVHLEQGLRLVHSLRCRMTLTGAFAGRIKKTPRSWKRSRALTNRLEPDDKATVDLLFWLGIMFDTLTSAMHKRPLVVSLEDSDLPATRGLPEDVVSEVQSAPAEDLWDAHLYPRQRKLRQRRPTRWPCTNEAATSVLCDAAPVKVLLFRKVTRIQTLMSRRVRGDRMEKAIQGALELCSHWQKLYAPFIRDCIAAHDQLPARVQSWYICLSSHWHLATLLLADLIEMVDDAELSDELQRHARHSSRLMAGFKELNCRSLSDIARAACPPKEVAHDLQGLNFAMNRQAILTEPWVVVLVRAFATAGVLLLECASVPEESELTQGEALARAEHCVRALRYLGQRSDAAFAAWTIIGEVLDKKREKFDEGVEKNGFAVEVVSGAEGGEWEALSR